MKRVVSFGHRWLPLTTLAVLPAVGITAFLVVFFLLPAYGVDGLSENQARGFYLSSLLMIVASLALVALVGSRILRAYNPRAFEGFVRWLGFSGRVRYLAAGLSIGAALVHGAVTPEHLSEWWGYGLFFIIAAMAQGLYGVVLLLQPWRYDEAGNIREGGDRYAQTYYILGVGGNAAIIALYIVTRTVGIPFFGPEAGEVEPITPIGLMSKIIEAALIGCLVGLIRQPPSACVSEDVGWPGGIKKKSGDSRDESRRPWSGPDPKSDGG
jgi:hypothetical protein